MLRNGYDVYRHAKGAVEKVYKIMAFREESRRIKRS